MCTTNDNHMIYGSSDLERDGPNVYFGPFFVLLPPSPSPLPPQQPKKSKFSKNEETPGEIIILQKCTINDNHMINGS